MLLNHIPIKIPILETEVQRDIGIGNTDDDDGEKRKGAQLVTADGTYISQSALSTTSQRKNDTV